MILYNSIPPNPKHFSTVNAWIRFCSGKWGFPHFQIGDGREAERYRHVGVVRYIEYNNVNVDVIQRYISLSFCYGETPWKLARPLRYWENTQITENVGIFNTDADHTLSFKLESKSAFKLQLYTYIYVRTRHNYTINIWSV